MPVVLTLGVTLFQDFEIPEQMPFGGEHMLVVKKLPGGQRVIDAMGRDDDEKSWSGRFRGIDAESRARELDSLRIAGQQQVLAWSSFRYLVVIKSFKGDFRQAYEIPYTITCTVISDLSNPIPVPVQTADDAVTGDVNSLGGLQFTSQAVTSAIAGVSTALGLVQGVTGRSSAQLAGLQSSLTAALSAVAVETTAQNAVVTASGSVGGVVAGAPPQQLASTLLGQASAFNQLGTLYQAQALLNRTRTNVVNAGS